MGERALIVIDMLNDFVLEGAPLEVPAARRVVPEIRREIDKARESGVPVIYVCDSHQPDDPEFRRFNWPPHAVKGTEGAKVVEDLKPLESEYVIEKTTYSGFYNTKLQALIEGLGVKRLRLTGCVTHICVLFTASDAVLRGYTVEVVRDAVAGLDPGDHEAGLRIMKNVLGAVIL